MKRRWILALPFLVFFGTSFASQWIQRSHFLGNTWFAALVGCLLAVPVISREKLWLGYAALLFPFALLGLQFALDWGSVTIGWD